MVQKECYYKEPPSKVDYSDCWKKGNKQVRRLYGRIVVGVELPYDLISHPASDQNLTPYNVQVENIFGVLTCVKPSVTRSGQNNKKNKKKKNYLRHKGGKA
jgi:hypothetical protein